MSKYATILAQSKQHGIYKQTYVHFLKHRKERHESTTLFVRLRAEQESYTALRQLELRENMFSTSYLIRELHLTQKNWKASV